MGTVKNLLIEKEIKAWNLFNGMIPAQDLAYVYCQDLMGSKLMNTNDLNLCEVCDISIPGHPPRTCGLVKPELYEKFSIERARLKVCWKNKKLAFNRSSKKIAIIN